MPDESTRLLDQEIKGEDEYNQEQMQKGSDALDEDEPFGQKPEMLMMKGQNITGQGKQPDQNNPFS